MRTSGSQLIWLSEPRLRSLALARAPAWLWSIDATQLIWANPNGAAIFGAATPQALAARRFDAGQPAAAQVLRLAETLPADGTPRLERLRGFGAGVGRALTCACSRVALADGSDAVLIAASEPAGADLPLADRARRLVVDVQDPVAAFGPDGELLAATPAAAALIEPVRSMGAAAFMAQAEESLRTGHTLLTDHGPMALHRLDTEAGPVIVVTEADAATPQHDAPVSAVSPASDAPDQADAGGDEATTATAGVPSPPAPAGSRPRRYPLRFIWQMDADGHFTIASDEFLELIGPHSAAALGRRWDDLAASLGIDPEGHVARAINSHDTWSGLSIAWPVDDGGSPLAIELSGLPVFDRERNFRGYRGFGVCRDLVRLGALAHGRLAQTASAVAPEAPPAAADTEGTRAGVPPPAVATAPESPEAIMRFSPDAQVDAKAPTLTPIERRAFSELARRLTTRLKQEGGEPTTAADERDEPPLPPDPLPGAPMLAEVAEAAKTASDPFLPADPVAQQTHRAAIDRQDVNEPISRATQSILDRLPTGVLVYRLEHLLYANRAFLDWAGQDDLASLMEAGGLNSLLIQPKGDSPAGPTYAVAREQDDRPTAEGRLVPVQWDAEEAHALVITIEPVVNAEASPAPAPPAVPAALQAEVRELRSILDTATDGVLVLDRDGRIAAANRSAEALFGEDAEALVGRPLTTLFAPESEQAAQGYLARSLQGNAASMLNGGLDVIGRERGGGLIPLFMTMGRLGEGSDKICAVFRDVTQWKRTEEELSEAKRHAERAAAAKSEFKSDFLAKVSHEIRTPLNSIIGFSEVMMQERFGPIGNERYRDYLKDIRGAGMHLIALVNDLVDLSKIEAGKLDLSFTGVALNGMVQECVAGMQPQANRERVIIRTSLSPKLPKVTADARSLRQIVLNLLSNSLRYTAAGGQVIVSTSVTDAGEVSLRVRDTGIGMTEQEIATAVEPFRQIATSTRFGSGGAGLGLPLTKAMVEANRASFHISSKPNAGTLVELTFPKVAMAAE